MSTATTISTSRSEEHTSELQSHSEISYAVFCLKKKKRQETKKEQTGKRRKQKTKTENTSRSHRSAGSSSCSRRSTLPISSFFFFNDTATTEIYTLSYTLSLHDALPISGPDATSRARPRRSGTRRRR